MRLFQKLKKKTDYKLEKVMIYAKITELKDRYMIYNSVKNERKWRNKKMDCDKEELEATKKNREKNADQMFEELDFKKCREDEEYAEYQDNSTIIKIGIGEVLINKRTKYKTAFMDEHVLRALVKKYEEKNGRKLN